MSLPFVSEKTPLPSIIVTPPPQNMPLSPDDSPFYIAFLAPPPKPSIWERILAFVSPMQIKARTAIILLVLMFIMACHVLSHRLAACRPRLEIGSGCSLVEQVAPWFAIFDFDDAATTPDAISL
jgi:COMPASS component SWD1